jgi:hypothetical protein
MEATASGGSGRASGLGIEGDQRSAIWCGRPESNRHRPCGPTDFHTRYGFRRPIPALVRAGTVWGLDYPFTLACGFRCCPSSLYTFPFPGLARDCHLTGFPEFGQFCIFGFPKSTQVWSKSVASTSFATPACGQ